jgi:hypothetical protein
MKFVLGVLVAGSLFAQDPTFTKDNRLQKPENYREWIYLSSGIGMTYGPARESSAGENPPFENVFVNPKAYKAFLESGNGRRARRSFWKSAPPPAKAPSTRPAISSRNASATKWK